MYIPFVDLNAQYMSIKLEIDSAIGRVIDQSAFIKGDEVTAFEKKYVSMLQVKHCISVGNGTDALFIALKCLGIGPGDEVITTALSWISTSEAITLTGAKCVYVDIENDYLCIDPKKIKEKINSRTRAIIPVHLYGQCADMDPICKIARENNLYIIEDAAQAHFSEYRGRFAGTMGDVGTFSFYPGKNLGAYGDAGALITNNDSIAQKVKMFANHGALVKHHHKTEGMNSRMDGIQAAVLNIKLKYIHKWNDERRRIAEIYNDCLYRNEGIQTPHERPGSKHVFHVYCIRTKKRDRIKEFLHDNGIQAKIHYPYALPFMEAYRYLKHRPEDFKVAYKTQFEILSIPLYPELSEENVQFICDKLQESIQ